MLFVILISMFVKNKGCCCIFESPHTAFSFAYDPHKEFIYKFSVKVGVLVILKQFAKLAKSPFLIVQ